MSGFDIINGRGGLALLDAIAERAKVPPLERADDMIARGVVDENGAVVLGETLDDLARRWCARIDAEEERRDEATS